MNSTGLDLSQAVEEIVRAAHDDFQLFSLDTQGACSYNALLITTTKTGVQSRRIIQARGSRFALDLDITTEATRVYGRLAPGTKFLARRTIPTNGVQDQVFYFYELNLIPGVPYSDLIPSETNLSDEPFTQQHGLVGDLAQFFARGWNHASNRPVPCNGKVGSQILSKLEKLSTQLPL
jgi:hypothetical protein